MNINNHFNEKLGVKQGKLSRLSGKPNCVATQTSQAAKKVPAVKYQTPVSEQIDRVIRTLESMPGAKIKQRTSHYVYAVFTSRLLRFKDDLEVYLDDDTKTLHFRSASRVGYSDFGVNKKRYERFCAALNQV